MLLITGANGQLGRLIVEEVLRREPDVSLAVSVRDVAAARDLARRGVEVRHGDYDDSALMRATFAGVDRLLLMPSPNPGQRVAQILPVVRAAGEAGIRHIVYPGGAADVEGLALPVFSAHEQVFAAIEDTGVASTHLRNAIYAEVIAGEVSGAIQAGELAAPVDGARVAPVLRSDLAAATAAVLLDESGHEGRTYDLTGSDTVGWDDLAALASERAGKPIPFRQIDDAEAEARLAAAGVPVEYIPAMVGFYAAYRAGWCGTPSGDLERLAGRPPTPSLQAIAAVLDGTAK